jgi:hypothetical protein
MIVSRRLLDGVFGMHREGHDTAPAKDMLASFERTQAMHIANRDQIAGKLAALD